MKDSLGLRLAQERRDFTELKKGKTNVGDVVLIQHFVGLIYTNVVGNLYTQKDLRFFWKTLFLERLFLFFWVLILIKRQDFIVRKTWFFLGFFSFFFILKDFQLIQKDLLFLILKDIFHQKDLDVKERHEISSERHEFLFSERLGCCNFLQKDLVVVIFFRKTCNFFFRKTCNFLQKDL